MSIWFRTPTIESVNRLHARTMADVLGIRVTEVGADFLRGEMPVETRTVQPHRVMHGGASAALAETLGSIGAHLTIDPEQHRCVGLTLNVNHIHALPEGRVALGMARPFHIGRSTQVWGIEVTNGEGKLVSVARLTMAVLDMSGVIESEA